MINGNSNHNTNYMLSHLRFLCLIGYTRLYINQQVENIYKYFVFHLEKKTSMNVVCATTYVIPTLHQRAYVGSTTVMQGGTPLHITNPVIPCSFLTSIPQATDLSPVILQQSGRQDHLVLILVASFCKVIWKILYKEKINWIEDAHCVTHSQRFLLEDAPSQFQLMSEGENGKQHVEHFLRKSRDS